MIDRETPPDNTMGQNHPRASSHQADVHTKHHTDVHTKHHTDVHTKHHTDVHTKHHTDAHTNHHTTDNLSPSSDDNGSADPTPPPLPSSHPLLSSIIPMFPVDKGSSPSCLLNVEAHSQSVRAAIDSFIETCLAGSSDDSSSPPYRPTSPSYKPPLSPSYDPSSPYKPSSISYKPSPPSYKSSSSSSKPCSPCRPLSPTNKTSVPPNRSLSPCELWSPYKSSPPSSKSLSPSCKSSSPPYKTSPPCQSSASSDQSSFSTSLFGQTDMDVLTVPENDDNAENRVIGDNLSDKNKNREEQSEEIRDRKDLKTEPNSFVIKDCDSVENSNSGMQNGDNDNLSNSIGRDDTGQCERKEKTSTGKTVSSNDDSDPNTNFSTEENTEPLTSLSTGDNPAKDTDTQVKTASVGNTRPELSDSVKESSTSLEHNILAESCESMDAIPGDNTKAVSGIEKADAGSSNKQQTSDISVCAVEEEVTNESKENVLACLQLQTIIDRVLDTSLGTAMHVNTVPHDQQLSQIPSHDLALPTSYSPLNTHSQEKTDPDVSKSTNEKSCNKTIAPLGMRFMDHIEKAVERSFSSITEGENRMEKENASAAKISGRKEDHNSVGQTQNNHQNPDPIITNHSCTEDLNHTTPTDGGETQTRNQNYIREIKNNNQNCAGENNENCDGEVRNTHPRSKGEVSETNPNCEGENESKNDRGDEEIQNHSQNSAKSTRSEESMSACGGGEGSRSVQDIVDRVVSQREGTGQGMVKSSASVTDCNTKPVSSSAGLRRDSAVSINNQTQHQPQQKPQPDPQQESRLEGQPTAQSPAQGALDTGEQSLSQTSTRADMPASVGPSQYQSSPATEIRASVRQSPSQSPRTEMSLSRQGGKHPSPDSYLKFMCAAVAKYGHRPSSLALMNAASATEAASKGNCPVASTQNTTTSVTQSSNPSPGIFPRPTSLRALRGSVPQPGVLTTPPPPLLKLNASEKLEMLHQQEICPQHPKRPRHVSCTCSSCTASLANSQSSRRTPSHEDSAERSDSQLPRQISHHLYHPYLKRSPARVPPFSQHWVAGRGWHPRSCQQEMMYPTPFSSVPSSYQALLSNCHNHGVRSALSYPLFACPDKGCWESKQAHPSHQKEESRKSMSLVCRQSKSVYNKAREMETDRCSQLHSVSSDNNILARNSVYARQPPPVTQQGSKQNVSMPDVSALYKQNQVYTSKVSDEDAPLDLSTKKMATASSQLQQNIKHRLEENHQHGANPLSISCIVDKAIEKETLSLAGQHFYNLENSAESYFRKLQHFHEHFARIRALQNDKNSGVQALRRNSGLPKRAEGLSPLPDHISQAPTSSVSQNIKAGHREGELTQTDASLYSVSTLPSAHVEQTETSAPSLLHAKLSSGLSLLDGGKGGQRLQSRPGFFTSRSTPPWSLNCAEYQKKGVRVVPVAPFTPALPVTPSPRIPSVNTVMTLPSASPLNSTEVLLEKDGMFSERGTVPSPSKGINSEPETNQAATASKHEPILNILGNNNPQDVLYLICRLCCQTYGNPYGFRKHFRSQHGLEPKAEHAIVQTISSLRNGQRMSDGTLSTLNAKYRVPESCSGAKLDHSSCPAFSSMFRPDTEDQFRRLKNPMTGIHSMEIKMDTKKDSSLGTKERPLPGSRGVGQDDSKCLECPECKQMFHLNDFGSYKRHCRQHGQVTSLPGVSGGGQVRFSCKDCQSSFPDVQMLQAHLALHQTHRTSLECGVGLFPSSMSSQDHVTGHFIKESVSSPPPATSTTSPTVSVSTQNQPNMSDTQSNTPSGMLVKSMNTPFSAAVDSHSDLKVCQLPADPTVTCASADSSSEDTDSLQVDSARLKAPDCNDSEMDKAYSDTDKLAVFKNRQFSSSFQTNSENRMMKTSFSDSVKTAASQESQKSQASDSSGFLPQTVPISKLTTIDSEDKGLAECDQLSFPDSDAVSTDRQLDTTLNNKKDSFLYKHKKFGAHRKRSGSSETSETESKKSRYETDVCTPTSTDEHTTV